MFLSLLNARYTLSRSAVAPQTESCSRDSSGTALSNFRGRWIRLATVRAHDRLRSKTGVSAYTCGTSSLDHMRPASSTPAIPAGAAVVEIAAPLAVPTHARAAATVGSVAPFPRQGRARLDWSFPLPTSRGGCYARARETWLW